MNAQFRRMYTLDVDQVYRLEKELFEDPWTRSSFLSELEGNDTTHAFVLQERDLIIGYCVCWYFVNELHIGNLAIAGKYQKKGLGSLLLEKVLAEFPESQFIYLEVRKGNKAAIALYQKFGFKNLYRRRAYYRNGEDALILVKIKEENNGLV